MSSAEEVLQERLADILLTLGGSGKIESEVSCPEVGTASGRSPKSVMSTVQAGSESLAEPTSTNKKSGLPKNAFASRTEEDKSDLIDVKGTSSEHGNKKSKGYKSNSALQLANTNDNSQIIDEKADLYLPNRKKEHDNGPDSSQCECPPSKEMEPTTQKVHKKGVEPQLSEKFKKDKGFVVSPSSNEKLPGTSCPKRARPPRVKSKKGGTGDAHVSSSSSHKAKAIEDTDTEVLLSSKKQKEGPKDSDGKPGRHSGTKQSAGNVEDSGKSKSSPRKMKVDAGSDEEGMLLRKLQKRRDSSNNEMVSSPKMAAKGDKDQVILVETLSRRKRSRAERLVAMASGNVTKVYMRRPRDGTLNESRRQAVYPTNCPMPSLTSFECQISKTPGHPLKFEESLVGANIEIWWPDDKKFYPCTVDSYNPDTKKHKVLYSDGDHEVLLLKNERFKFIGDGEGQEEKINLSPEAASEMSRKKAKKSGVSSALSESEEMRFSSRHVNDDCGTHGDKGTGTTTTTEVLRTAMRASVEASARLRLLGGQIEAMIRLDKAAQEREAALRKENKRLRVAAKKAAAREREAALKKENKRLRGAAKRAAAREREAALRKENKRLRVAAKMAEERVQAAERLGWPIEYALFPPGPSPTSCIGGAHC